MAPSLGNFALWLSLFFAIFQFFISKRNNLKLIKIDGVKFDIIQNKWVLSEDKLVNYIAQFKKF